MQNFAGMIEYLLSWVWVSAMVIRARQDVRFDVSCLPLLLDDLGRVVPVGVYSEGASVFASDRAAFEYLCHLARQDLQFRGMRDHRVSNFEFKQEANFLLYKKVAACQDDVEYDRLRQAWDTLNRPKYQDMTWAPAQVAALARIAVGLSHELSLIHI